MHRSSSFPYVVEVLVPPVAEDGEYRKMGLMLWAGSRQEAQMKATTLMGRVPISVKEQREPRREALASELSSRRYRDHHVVPVPPRLGIE